jgi:hypothetical protein
MRTPRVKQIPRRKQSLRFEDRGPTSKRTETISASFHSFAALVLRAGLASPLPPPSRRQQWGQIQSETEFATLRPKLEPKNGQLDILVVDQFSITKAEDRHRGYRGSSDAPRLKMSPPPRGRWVFEDKCLRQRVEPLLEAVKPVLNILTQIPPEG